jgi:hypothetical protein
MSAKIDASDFSVITYCTDCPSWVRSVSSVEQGHTLACSHEAEFHPDSRAAMNAASRWRKKNVLHV